MVLASRAVSQIANSSMLPSQYAAPLNALPTNISVVALWIASTLASDGLVIEVSVPFTYNLNAPALNVRTK